MKQLLIALIFAVAASHCNSALAQLAPQAFVGNKAIEYNFLWYKNIDSTGKVSLFNFTTFNVDYNDQVSNTYEIYQVGIYNFNKTWGLAGGGRFIGNEFIPLVALSYQKATPNLYFNLFPSAQYVPGTRQVNYSLFGLLFYRPKINDTWKAFNQFTFEPLFNADKHIYSYQQFRIGLEYKERFQFGLGANLDQTGEDYTFRQNYGVFIRKEFN